MGKSPAFQFYVKDWLGDPLLKMVSHQTKGIWIDLLCFLWDSPDRGRLSASNEQFQKMLGCNALEWEQFTREMSVTKFADFQNDNGFVTVKNRRMYREEKNRKNTYIRVKRFREKQPRNAPCNDSVTPPSSSSSSNIINNKNFSKGVTVKKYYKDERGNFICSTCQKSFMDYNNLQAHFKDHYKNNT